MGEQDRRVCSHPTGITGSLHTPQLQQRQPEETLNLTSSIPHRQQAQKHRTKPPSLSQGLTVGLLWLRCGGGQAGGWCTGPIGVPGLPAVVAELGAAALAAAGEARTLGAAVGKHGVAAGRR